LLTNTFTMDIDTRSLYEGKMNLIVDRFRTAFGIRNGKGVFIIQVMDFGNNVAREHFFKNTNDMLNAAKFLKTCGLINV
jgi:hypothetical protein